MLGCPFEIPSFHTLVAIFLVVVLETPLRAVVLLNLRRRLPDFEDTEEY